MASGAATQTPAASLSTPGASTSSVVDLVGDGDTDDDGEGIAHESAWFDFGPQPRVPTSTRPMNNALALAEMEIVTGALQCSRRYNTRVFVDLKPVEIEINGTAMKRLQFGGWLQDDHINGYMYLLNRAGPVNRLLAFSSFFMVKLMNDGGGYSYAGVRRWTIWPSRTTPVAVTGSCCTSTTTPKKYAVTIAMVGVTNAKLARSFGICRTSSQHAIRENARDTTHILRMASPLGASPLKVEMRRNAVYSCVPLRDTSFVASGNALAYGMNEIRVFRSCITLELLERRIR